MSIHHWVVIEGEDVNLTYRVEEEPALVCRTWKRKSERREKFCFDLRRRVIILIGDGILAVPLSASKVPAGTLAQGCVPRLRVCYYMYFQGFKVACGEPTRHPIGLILAAQGFCGGVYSPQAPRLDLGR